MFREINKTFNGSGSDDLLFFIFSQKNWQNPLTSIHIYGIIYLVVEGRANACSSINLNIER